MNRQRSGWFHPRVRALEGRHLLSGVVTPAVTGDGAVELPPPPEEGRAVLVAKATLAPTGDWAAVAVPVTTEDSAPPPPAAASPSNDSSTSPADARDSTSATPAATTLGSAPATSGATSQDNSSTTPPAGQSTGGPKAPPGSIPAAPGSPQQSAATPAVTGAEDAARPATDTQDTAEDVQDAAAGAETPEVVAPTAGQPAFAVGQGAETPPPAGIGGDAHALPGPEANAAAAGQSGAATQASAASPAAHPGALPAADPVDVQQGPAFYDPPPTAAKVWGGSDGEVVSAARALVFWQAHALGTLDVAALASVPPADLLTDILPVNAAALGAHVQRFLDRLDDVGKSVAEPLGGGQLYYWLAGAAAVGAALEFARRRAALSGGAVRLTGLSDVLDPDLLVPADLTSPEQP
jgi:hypothetical protein